MSLFRESRSRSRIASLSLATEPQFHVDALHVAPRILPLIERVGDGITELRIRQNLGRNIVEPLLEGVEHRNAVFVAETADIIGPNFPFIRLSSCARLSIL